MPQELIEYSFDRLAEESRFRVVEDVDTQTGKKRMKLLGVCQKAEALNRNKRIYPKVVLESAVGRLQEKIKAGRGFGELDHPQTTPSLKNTSHLVTNVWWDKEDPNLLCCEVVVLDTPYGEVLKEIVRAGGRPGFSSRGYGDVEKVQLGEELVEKVKPGYELESFDFVVDPSVTPATITQVVEGAIKKYVSEVKMEIKDVNKLREKFPDLVKQLEEKVMTETERAAAEELKEMAEKLDAVTEQANASAQKIVGFISGLLDLLVEHGFIEEEEEETEEEEEEEEDEEETEEEETEEEETIEDEQLGKFRKESADKDDSIVEQEDEEEEDEEDWTELTDEDEEDEEEKKKKNGEEEEDEEEKKKKNGEEEEEEEMEESVAKKVMAENEMLKLLLAEKVAKERELEEQARKAQVIEKVEEIASKSKFPALIKRRLQECKSVEEVEKKVDEMNALLAEVEASFGGSGIKQKGVSKVENTEDAELRAIREAAKRQAGIVSKKK